MNVFEELDNIFKFGYNSENLRAIKPKLDNYLTTCPEENKAICRRKIDLVERLIEEHKEMDKFRQQYTLLHDYVLNNAKLGLVELEYTEPFGKSYGVEVKVGNYVMELVYKPIMNEPEKNEVRAKFYINVNDLYKAFMIKKDVIPLDCAVLQHKRRDYYPTSVRFDNWGDLIIDSIRKVVSNPESFLQMCQSSCPYNNDGTHKYKSWKTKAKVEIAYEANTGIIQGVKSGETPSEAHIVGGNGSFRFFDKGNYVLKIKLDCLACEKPIKYDCNVDIDSFMRQLKEAKGWGRNLPYKKVDSVLSEKIEVITHDMDKDPEERSFYPVDYDGNWITFLEEKFREI